MRPLALYAAIRKIFDGRDFPAGARLAHARSDGRPTREYVNGGQSGEPITEGQRKAVLRLNRAAELELGADRSALVRDVLVQGMTMEQVGQRGVCAANAGAILSRRFRECCDLLAMLHGFSTGNPVSSNSSALNCKVLHSLPASSPDLISVRPGESPQDSVPDLHRVSRVVASRSRLAKYPAGFDVARQARSGPVRSGRPCRPRLLAPCRRR